MAADTVGRQQTLQRELGAGGATMLGLGSIVGTGVFVSIGLAAGQAGTSVLLAIALAALLATCNALSSAQLAAAHPVSGGTYEYGYRLLTPALGFTAGWMFLCAKMASAATAALGTAAYAMHLAGLDGHAALLPWCGCAVAVLVTALVLGGMRRTSIVNVLIVSFTLIALGALMIGALLHSLAPGHDARLTPLFRAAPGEPLDAVLYATALIFVAYTGYGRIATLGEEVRSPERTIPRAIAATMVISFLLYLGVAAAALGVIGAEALAAAARERGTPLESVARDLDVPGLTLLVAAGAVTAMLGVLLNLVLGLSRVALAMGRRHDLPPALATLSAGRTPRSAILLVGGAIAALALVGDIETTWSFSAFTVLVYYALTNLAALRLPVAQRRYPRAVAWGGLTGCMLLAAWLPRSVWLPGLLLILAGLAWRPLAQWLWPGRTAAPPPGRP